MRSRYGDYPEYHTSLDNLEDVVTPSGLQGGFDFVRDCITDLEDEFVLQAQQCAEPQLGRRGLYHAMLNKNTSDIVMLRTNVLAYADGQHSIEDLADLLQRPADEITEVAEELHDHGLVRFEHQGVS
jgi:aminopeptidase-like protein